MSTSMIPLAPRKQKMIGYLNNTKIGMGPKALPSTTQSPPSGLDQPSQSRHPKGKASTSAKGNGWRRYGIERRRMLLSHDEAEGGNRFVLNNSCRIQGYFSLSEKIIAKFNASFQGGRDLEGTYIMGHRLKHFLTEALPRHPAYMLKDPVVSRLREKSFQSLVHLQHKISALALKIDEEQLNKYIMHDFDPFGDDDEGSCTSSTYSDSDEAAARKDIQWENFDGWSFDLPEKLTQPNLSGKKNLEFVQDSFCQVADVSGETEDTSNETFSSSEISFQASDEFEPIYDSFGLEFLRRIASENVRYETDSEAADSWAQESEIESTVYSVNSRSIGNTCDPARIALKELMINKRQRPQRSKVSSYQDDDDGKDEKGYDLSSGSSFDSADEEEIWIAFDPTSLMPSGADFPPDRVSL